MDVERLGCMRFLCSLLVFGLCAADEHVVDDAPAEEWLIFRKARECRTPQAEIPIYDRSYGAISVSYGHDDVHGILRVCDCSLQKTLTVSMDYSDTEGDCSLIRFSFLHKGVVKKRATICTRLTDAEKRLGSMTLFPPGEMRPATYFFQIPYCVDVRPKCLCAVRSDALYTEIIRFIFSCDRRRGWVVCLRIPYVVLGEMQVLWGKSNYVAPDVLVKGSSEQVFIFDESLLRK